MIHLKLFLLAYMRTHIIGSLHRLEYFEHAPIECITYSDEKRGRRKTSTQHLNTHPHTSIPHELAFAFFNVLRTASLLCFFAIITPKRSKSVSVLRVLRAASFFAHEEVPHFSVSLNSSTRLRTTPVPDARGSLGTTSWVRTRWRKGKAWRSTPVVGPSMIACNIASYRVESSCRVISIGRKDSWWW